MKTTIWPSNSTLSIYSKEMNIQVHTKARTQISTAVLLDKNPTLKTAYCPSTGEWIKKMWNSLKMKYYSAIEKNKLLLLGDKNLLKLIYGDDPITEVTKYHWIIQLKWIK